MAISGQEGKGRWLATSGAGLFVLIVVQMILGAILAMRYPVSPSDAHQFVDHHRNDALGRYLTNFHYWGSAVLLVFAAIHVVAMLWAGWYKSPHVGRWLASVGLLLCAFLFQVTGNLLPYDRHDVSTAVVEGGIAASAPVFGRGVSNVVLQGQTFNDNTLAAWYAAHAYWIPLLLVILTAGSVITHVRHHPYKEYKLAALIPFVIAIALTFLISAPRGAAATAADYDNYSAKVSWYTWPMHGSLNAFNGINPSLGWIGAIAIPTALFGFLVLLPWLSKRVNSFTLQTTFIVFVVYFLGVGFAFGGSFAPLTGNQDPPAIEVAAPPEKTSVVDAVLAARGKDLFNTKTCSDCHGKDGKEALGGPNLAKSETKHNDPMWYVEFIRAPSKVKPGSTMPGFPKLTADELRAIAEYLAHPH